MGARGVPKVATEAAVLSHLPGAEELPEAHGGEIENAKVRRRQANQDRRKAQKRRKQAQRDELLRLRANAAKTENPKGKSGGKGKSKKSTKEEEKPES